MEQPTNIELPAGVCVRCFKDVGSEWDPEIPFIPCVKCGRYCSAECMQLDSQKEDPSELEDPAAAPNVTTPNVATPNVATARQEDCTCGRGYVLDIELCTQKQLDLGDNDARIYRQVSCAKNTTFTELSRICDILFFTESCPPWTFYDVQWNRVVCDLEVEFPYGELPSAEVRQRFYHANCEIMAQRVRTTENAALTLEYQKSDPLIAWFGFSEQRTHFWAFKGCFPKEYRCYLITVRGRTEPGQTKPVLLEASQHLDDEEIMGLCLDGARGMLTWKHLHNSFGKLSYPEIMARLDIPGDKAPVQDIRDLNLSLASFKLRDGSTNMTWHEEEDLPEIKAEEVKNEHLEVKSEDTSIKQESPAPQSQGSTNDKSENVEIKEEMID